MSHSIPLNDAIIMVQRYRDSHGHDNLKALSLPKEDLTELLNQEGCEGLRFYLASQYDGSLDLIVIAYDRENNDMPDLIKNHLNRCPSNCSAEGPLAEI
jgi:hypothetical protein